MGMLGKCYLAENEKNKKIFAGCLRLDRFQCLHSEGLFALSQQPDRRSAGLSFTHIENRIHGIAGTEIRVIAM